MTSSPYSIFIMKLQLKFSYCIASGLANELCINRFIQDRNVSWIVTPSWTTMVLYLGT
jgi:hypothetical protein